jgi:hypothetical protein
MCEMFFFHFSSFSVDLGGINIPMTDPRFAGASARRSFTLALDLLDAMRTFSKRGLANAES